MGGLGESEMGHKAKRGGAARKGGCAGRGRLARRAGGLPERKIAAPLSLAGGQLSTAWRGGRRQCFDTPF